MSKTDSISLEDLKTGQDSVLKVVYEENRPKFLNFAKRYDLREEDVVDIYQNAFMAFYDNVMNGRIKEFTSSISTYIISIGKYQVFDALKMRKRTLDKGFDVTLIQEIDEDISHLEIETDALTTEQKKLYEHFGELGKKCQELLTLFYYRGFTINDILKHSDYASENVIKSTKSRCLKNLRERIFTSEI